MIYLDNSATTPVAKEVFEAMIPYLTTEYGNPSSKYYEHAIRAREAVEQARINVAKLINAKPEEIIFTSGATESTNMIIKGVSDYKKYYEKKGNHIITTKVEHKATINTCKFLNGEIYSNNDATFSIDGKLSKVDRGFDVTFLDVNKNGQVEPETLENAIKDKTVLASIIWGNNEIGSLNDINRLYAVCEKNHIPFHTDATQILGKIDINVKKVPVNFMSFSAHKLHGPKGVGAAYIKADDYGMPPFSALLHGGEQENGMRGSTLAVHNIVGFGKAAEVAFREREIVNKYYNELDGQIIALIENNSNLQLLGDINNRLPGIYSIIINIKDFNNERFLKKIGSEVAISTGSACTAGQPSHVLQAIGLGDYTSKVIRISVGNLDDKILVVDEMKKLFHKINSYA